MSVQSRRPPRVRIGALLVETARQVPSRPLVVLMLLGLLMLSRLPNPLSQETLSRSLVAGHVNPPVLVGLAIEELLYALVLAGAAAAAWQTRPWLTFGGRWLRVLPVALLASALQDLPGILVQALAAMWPTLFDVSSVTLTALAFMAIGFSSLLGHAAFMAFALIAVSVRASEGTAIGASLRRALRLSRGSRWAVALTYLAMAFAGATSVVVASALLWPPSPAAAKTSASVAGFLDSLNTLFWCLAARPLYLERRQAHEGVRGDMLETFD